MTQPTDPLLREFTSNGITLRYLDRGLPDQPPIILLHGIRDQARNWDLIAERLAVRHRIIAVDLRGHGDSDWSPDGAYLLAYHVGDLARLVETLDCDRVTLIGHSYGGSVASRYAGLFPGRIARLIVVDGFGPRKAVYDQWAAEGVLQRTRDWLAQRAALAARPARRLASIEDGMERLAHGNPRLTRDQLDHFARHALRPDDGGYSWKFDPRVSVFAPEDFAIPLTEFWPSISAPALFCYGAESWSALSDEEDRRGLPPDCRLAAIPGAGHWPHHDAPDLFLDLVNGFLDAEIGGDVATG